MNKRILSAVTAAFFMSSISVSAKTDLLSVYQRAMSFDPQILSSESQLKASEERINQSFARLLPQLTGSAGYDKRSSSSKTGGQTYSDTESDGDSIGITLSQSIYDHANWKSLDIAEKQAVISGINHNKEKQNLIIRVAEAYFNVLAAQDGLAFAQAEKHAVGQQLEQTNHKFAVGLIATTDVHEAQATYDQAIADEIAAQNALNNIIESLREITNEYYSELAPLKNDFNMSPPQPNDINKWVKVSQENNLDLKSSKMSMEVARQRIKLSQSGHYPTLSLTGSLTNSGGSSTNKLEGFRDGAVIPAGETFSSTTESQSVSLNLNIPIYSGGSTSSAVKEAQHNFKTETFNLERALRSAVGQTRSSYLGVLSSISSVNALKQSTLSSQSALEATQAGLEVGTRTIVDVLLNTRTLYSAKRSLARARYDYILNTLKLKQAAGTLQERDVEMVNALLQKN